MIKLLHKLASKFWKIVQPITVGVRIILFQNNEVLLVKHSYSDFWYLPGGGLKKKETFQQAIERELFEELGILVEELKLHGVYNNFFEGKNDNIVVFSSDKFTKPTQKSHEIESFQFFKLDELPQKISPGTKKRIIEFQNSVITHYGLW